MILLVYRMNMLFYMKLNNRFIKGENKSGFRIDRVGFLL